MNLTRESFLNGIVPIYKAPAHESEPTSSRLSLDVKSGRVVMAFHGNTVNDRRLRSSWNYYLRPMVGVPTEVQLVRPKKRFIDWASSNAQSVVVSEIRALREEIAAERATEQETVDTLESDLLVAMPGPKRKVKRFTDLQTLDLLQKNLNDARSALGETDIQLKAVEWFLSNMKVFDKTKARFPVVVPAVAGRSIELYCKTKPVPSDVEQLVSKAKTLQSTIVDPYTALFTLAPERAVGKDDSGKLTVLSMPEDYAAPLAKWYKDYAAKRVRVMLPDASGAWAWFELMASVNSTLPEGKKLKFPPGLHPPRDSKPNGYSRDSSRLAKLTAEVSALTDQISKGTVVPKPTTTVVEHPAVHGGSYKGFPLISPPKDSGREMVRPLQINRAVIQLIDAGGDVVAINHVYKLAVNMNMTVQDAIATCREPGTISVDTVPGQAPVLGWTRYQSAKMRLAMSKRDQKRLQINIAEEERIVADHEKLRASITSDSDDQLIEEEEEEDDSSSSPPSRTPTPEGKPVKEEPIQGPSNQNYLRVRNEAIAVAQLNMWITEIDMYLAQDDDSLPTLQSNPDFDFSGKPETARELMERLKENLNLLEDVSEAYLLEVIWRTYSELLLKDAGKPDDEEVFEIVSPEVELPDPEVEDLSKDELVLDGLRAMRVDTLEQIPDTPRGLADMFVVRQGILYHVGFHPLPKKSLESHWVETQEVVGPVFVPEGGNYQKSNVIKALKPSDRKEGEGVSQPTAQPDPKGKGKAKEVAKPVEPSPAPDVKTAEALTEVKLRKKFPQLPGRIAKPGEDDSTQMNLCDCDLYPCKHTKDDIQGAYKFAKTKVSRPPRAKRQDWATPSIEWPKPAGDKLEKPNPANVKQLRTHLQRIPEEQLERLRAAMGKTKDPLPPNYLSLSSEDQAKERARRVIPRWATAAVSADPANIDKIRKGEITAASKVAGKPVNPAPDTSSAKKQEEEKGKVSAGDRWKAVKDKFPNVKLAENPRSPDEKRFKKAYQQLKTELGEKTAKSVLPKLTRQDSRSSNANKRSSRSQDSLEPLLTSVKMLGAIFSAFRGA